MSITGIENTVMQLEMAVNVTDSATFPFATWVIRLLVAPPGQAAIIIRPTAIAGGKLKRTARVNAKIGSMISWFVRPRMAALGYRKTRRKSSTTKVMPIPNMIIPSETGRTTEVSTESSIFKAFEN